MKKLLSFLVTFVLFNCSIAQAPQSTSYQAIIRNNNGIAIGNQQVKVRFSIHDSIENGVILYQEIQNVTTNAQGLINVFAGNGTVVSGNFSNINWSKNKKFFSVEIDATGGDNFINMGTTQLVSVPYSLFANNATNAINANTALTANTANSAQTASTAYFSHQALSANHANTATTAENGMPNGTSNGDLLFWDGSIWKKLPAGEYGQALVICNGVPTWGGCLPIISSTNMMIVSGQAARVKVNISTDGSNAITSRGVCWSTSTNPTVESNRKTINGTGTGEFNTEINGLVTNTNYFLRAYATNAKGTVYGSEQTFTTLSLPSIIIGNQNWSSTNLNVSNYRNGDVIPQITDMNQWQTTTSGAWCWYQNDSVNYAAFGKLYNWYAVNDPRGLAPEGWHVPTKDDWITLDVSLVDHVGERLKSRELWIQGLSTYQNSSNFTAYPAGLRDNFGAFGNFGYNTYYWSSTLEGASSSIIRYLGNFLILDATISDHHNGYSVRLVKD